MILKIGKVNFNIVSILKGFWVYVIWRGRVVNEVLKWLESLILIKGNENNWLIFKSMVDYFCFFNFFGSIVY